MVLVSQAALHQISLIGGVSTARRPSPGASLSTARFATEPSTRFVQLSRMPMR
jgi:hypothetical protein